MKRFLLIFFAFWILFFAAIIGIRYYWVKSFPNKLQRNFLKENQHILVVGPSNTAFSWNDRIIKDTKNLSQTALTMGGCYNVIKWAVEYNKTKIDTVYLGASLIGIIYNNDTEINPMFEEDKRLLDYDYYFKEFCLDPEYIKIAIGSFGRTNFSKRSLGGTYEDLNRDRLHHRRASDKLNRIKECAGDEGWTENNIRKLCAYQVDHLKRINQYCKDHNIALVFLSTPVYHFDEKISDRGYRDFIKSEFGDSALIADYSRFEFPDDTYYADIEHLNKKGAEYFSKYIEEHGVDLQYSIDYCKK